MFSLFTIKREEVQYIHYMHKLNGFKQFLAFQKLIPHYITLLPPLTLAICVKNNYFTNETYFWIEWKNWKLMEKAYNAM